MILRLFYSTGSDRNEEEYYRNQPENLVVAEEQSAVCSTETGYSIL